MTWAIGSTQNVTWSSANLSGNVKMELSRDGGATWSIIIGAAPVSGTRPWRVVGPATMRARIRVTSLTDPAIYVSSEGDFTIVGP